MSQLAFGQKVLEFYKQLTPDWSLPEGFSTIYPFGDPSVQESMASFYNKFYHDENERVFLFGINPGRFGAGITGIPFTDPISLDKSCGIENEFEKRHELSSQFIYNMIEAMGGASKFYRRFYISSICPLGFLKAGNNANYYDDKALYQAVKPHIVESIQRQIAFGANIDIAFSIGKGTNMKFFEKLNKEFGFFKSLHALPHPRWVMQYRRKKLDTFIDEYKEKLST